MFTIVDPSEVAVKLSTMVIMKDGRKIPSRLVKYLTCKCPSCSNPIYDEHEELLIKHTNTCFTCNPEALLTNISIIQYVPELDLGSYIASCRRLAPETSDFAHQWVIQKARYRVRWTHEQLEIYLRNRDGIRLLREARSVKDLDKIPIKEGELGFRNIGKRISTPKFLGGEVNQTTIKPIGG